MRRLHIASILAVLLTISCTPMSDSEIGVTAATNETTEAPGEPSVVEKPDSGLQWSEGRYFPQFPQAEMMYVFRLPMPISDHRHGATEESWRIDQSAVMMMNLTLVGIQGIINRTQPSVYVEWYDPLFPDLTEGSAHWASLLDDKVDVERLDLDAAGAIRFLMERYSNWFRGIVVYDPTVPDTINLATMIAGLEDRIMLAPDQIGMPGIPDYGSVTDLRDLVQLMGWDSTETSKHDIYSWAYDNLWPLLEKRVIGVVSPGPPTSRELPLGSGFYQLDVTPRDYLIALRSPALWLSPDDEPDASLFHRYLDDAPSPIPLTGVFAGSEHSTVRIASEHGDFIAGMNWPGGWITTGSLSALSAIRSPAASYDDPIDPGQILSTIGASHVATLTSSDGDALYYQLGQGFGPRFGWRYVQEQRFGWTISPLLAEVAPMVWADYLEDRTDVRLLAGVSGVGYGFPEFMDARQLDAYLSRSAIYMSETGLRTVTIPSKIRLSEEIPRRYYEKLSSVGLLGIFTDWQFSKHNLSFIYPDAPSPVVWARVPPLNDRNLNDIVEAIMSYNNQVYVELPIGAPERGTLVHDPDASGGTALRIDQAARSEGRAITLAHSVGFLPGEYQMRVSMKIDNNIDQNIALGELILSDTDSNQVIASREIVSSDFTRGDEYEPTAVSFTVETMTHSIELWLRNFTGATNLYLDVITTTSNDETSFPVFTAIGIDNIGEAESRTPERFAEAFEVLGGVILDPDEFMAALNPEFMIGFAEPLLGPNHPALDQARLHLAAGEYFESLAATRAALESWLSG